MRENKISIKPVISLFLHHNQVIDVWLLGMLSNNFEYALCQDVHRKQVFD